MTSSTCLLTIALGACFVLCAEAGGPHPLWGGVDYNRRRDQDTFAKWTNDENESGSDNANFDEERLADGRYRLDRDWNNDFAKNFDRRASSGDSDIYGESGLYADGSGFNRGSLHSNRASANRAGASSGTSQGFENRYRGPVGYPVVNVIAPGPFGKFAAGRGLKVAAPVVQVPTGKVVPAGQVVVPIRGGPVGGEYFRMAEKNNYADIDDRENASGNSDEYDDEERGADGSYRRNQFHDNDFAKNFNRGAYSGDNDLFEDRVVNADGSFRRLSRGKKNFALAKHGGAGSGASKGYSNMLVLPRLAYPAVVPAYQRPVVPVVQQTVVPKYQQVVVPAVPVQQQVAVPVRYGKQ